MPNGIFKELSNIDCVEAITLGGSRANKVYDENSDYDVYVYYNAPIDIEIRKKILYQYCNVVEIGNHFWEYEDNCILNNGIAIDIIYRNLYDFCKDIENVVIHYQTANAYTTCMWHNLIHSNIIYDKNGLLKKAVKKFNIPYPQQLKKAIIQRQLKLMDTALPAYKTQIEKAIKRNDMVSINHRVTEFLASYFDFIFAVNEKTHTGEKRLIELCKKNCTILPQNFEQNLNLLFSHMYDTEKQFQVIDDINRIIVYAKQIVTIS